jgi:hypothetical protein
MFAKSLRTELAIDWTWGFPALLLVNKIETIWEAEARAVSLENCEELSIRLRAIEKMGAAMSRSRIPSATSIEDVCKRRTAKSSSQFRVNLRKIRRMVVKAAPWKALRESNIAFPRFLRVFALRPEQTPTKARTRGQSAEAMGMV